MKKNEINFYRDLINQFSQTKILVIGDMMVDRFVRGKVTRISPEAPVPVVRVQEEIELPGGAGNVMMNLASLQAKVSCCSVIGPDETGSRLIDRFRSHGILTDGVFQDADRITTLKTRVIAEHQQVVRFDHENTQVISQSIQNKIQKFIIQTIPQVNAVILSDYGKGMIIPSVLSTAIQTARKYHKPICVDPKIEHFLSYKKVTCITPNLSEALGGMHRVQIQGKEALHQLGKDILKTLQCESVLITQGEDGMTLFDKKQIVNIPAKAQEVFDVTGAGDTVISVLALSLACGASLFHGAILSNLAAGIVIGKLGTATITPPELKEALKRL